MYMIFLLFICFFFFKQKTAYEMRISDWSSDVCSSDLVERSQLAQDDFMFADMPDLPPGERAPAGPMEERALMDEGPEFKNDKLPGRTFDKAADKILEDGGVSFDFRGDHTYQVVVGTPGNDNRHGSTA